MEGDSYLHFQLLWWNKDQRPLLQFPLLLKPQLPSSVLKALVTCIRIRLSHLEWQIIIWLDQDDMWPLHLWVPLYL